MVRGKLAEAFRGEARDTSGEKLAAGKRDGGLAGIPIRKEVAGQAGK